MSDETKKTVEFPQEMPFNPFLALDLGERWGRELGRVEAKLDAVYLKVNDQGKAISAIQDELTTFKAEMAEFKTEMAEFKAETRAESAALRAELKAESAELRNELKAETTALIFTARS